MAYAIPILGMEKVNGTPLQKQIEYIVTNGRGYEPRESGCNIFTGNERLAQTLYCMETADGFVDKDDEVPGCV